jgi:cytochrome c biogenesis factor
MILFAVLFFIYSVVKKTYRYIPVCISVILYAIIFQLRGDPSIVSMPFFDLLSVFEWIMLAAVLTVVIWTCTKQKEGEKINSLPIILSVSALAVRIVRFISYEVLIQRAIRPGADVMQMIRILDRIYTIANAAFEIVLCAVLFSLFWRACRQSQRTEV